MYIGKIAGCMAVWSISTAAVAAVHAPGTADAKAEAQALIAAANAGAYFVEDSEGEVPAVRHLASGLRCTFEPHAKLNKITIYPVSDPTVPEGDDVSCETKSVGFAVSIYATRYGAPTTADEQLGVAVSAIRQRFTDVEPFTGTGASASDSGAGPKLPMHKTARFKAKLDGMRYFTRASVAMVDGWTVLQRVSGPLSDAIQGDLLGELDMIGTLTEMTKAPKPPI